MIHKFFQTKLKAIKNLVRDVPRLIRDRYSLLYPHGIYRFVENEYPEFRGIEVFVETGTFQGKTAQQESRYFRDVYTIELNEKLYNENLEKFRILTPNVKPYLGDSAVLLPQVLHGIQEPCVIFLDAHWSGDSRVNWSKSKWKGYGLDTSFRGENWPPSTEQQCPLVDEASIIGIQFRFPCVLIIDDWDSIGKKDRGFAGEDWRSITEEEVVFALGKDRVKYCFECAYQDKKRKVFLLDKL